MLEWFFNHSTYRKCIVFFSSLVVLFEGSLLEWRLLFFGEILWWVRQFSSEAIIWGGGAIIQGAIVLEPNKIVKDTHREKKASYVSPVTWIHEYGHLGIWYIKSTIKDVVTPFFVRGPFCTLHFISLNIGFWRCSFVLKYYVFNLSTFN